MLVTSWASWPCCSRVPRTATIVADTDIDALVVGQRVIDTLLDDIPGLAKRLLKVVAARCADTAASV